MKKHNPYQIRIIAGLWRGRMISFPHDLAIRPTPNRVRETLFNWLAQPIVNANCLDTFAGSGALGLEALSRGAKHVTFIDKNRQVTQSLQDNLKKLDCQDATCYTSTVPNTTLNFTHPFDIIFLDPPFDSDLILPTMQWLKPYCHPGTLVYLESKDAKADLLLHDNWETLKAKRAGHVHYFLLQNMTQSVASEYESHL
jgi:16S rRNA (guanine966-N2)-methyltransferase